MPRFTPEFLDELKSRLRPSDVIGRYVKLRKQGNEWAGLSPFTKEKTPSFFVNDQKGFYHCFSSGKHGDIFKFLSETQGVSFPEAVARLAEEAGLPLPAADADEAERSSRRKGLTQACRAAADYYASMLRRAEGRPGADYFARRGVRAEEIAAFRLGFAPAGRTALKEHLLFKGFAEEPLIEAGLLIRPDDGGASYDRFRGRVIFPITSPSGDVIGFGGRALEKDAKPKYLNSPETPLFHKSDVLYNFGSARAAATATNAPLIVCEGYMDVIALVGAGFAAAVAPLGTALGATQLQMLWRVCDEPLICLDGDRAGVAAAYRTIDRALALLKPGKSLSFVLLPDNQDPDELVRAGGRNAVERALAGAAPMVDILWRRETETRPLNTPERRAALKAHLRELTQTIADPDVRAAYGADLARRLDAAFASPPAVERPARRPMTKKGARSLGRAWAAPTLMDGKASAALKNRAAPSAYRREASLVLGLVLRPELFAQKESDVMGLRLEDSRLARLLDEIVSAFLADPNLDSANLKRHLHQTGSVETLERILDDEALTMQTFLRPTAEFEDVAEGWNNALRLHLSCLGRAEAAHAAVESLAEGDERWKAVVAIREEAANATEGLSSGGGSDEATPVDFLTSLETLKANIARKSRR